MTSPLNDPYAKVAPEFFVRDLDVSLRFYTALGGAVFRRERDFAVITLDGAQLLLALAGEGREAGQTGTTFNLRIMVEDVDLMYGRALGAGGRIVAPVDNRDYGLRDFIVADPDGFLLRFASMMGT
ncbi:MAG TPA: VOC family protein [Dehalococcoidia bacterium]|nr:VOC family protein [Dehalococcoidia bacterium]